MNKFITKHKNIIYLVLLYCHLFFLIPTALCREYEIPNAGWTGSTKDNKIIYEKDIREAIRKHSLFLKEIGYKPVDVPDTMINIDMDNKNKYFFEIKNNFLPAPTITGVYIIDLTNEVKKLNFTGANLKNVDMSGAVLSRAVLAEAKLDNANLSNIDLSYSDLTKASLKNANLRGAIIINAEMKDVNLTGADLTGAVIFYTNINGSSILDGANLSHTRLREARFTNSKMEGANFNNSEVFFSDFNNTHLSNSTFVNSFIYKSNFADSQMKVVNITGSNIEASVFSGTNLLKSNLSNTKLNNVKLNDASLESSNLSMARLLNVDLKGSILANADLSFSQYEVINVPDQNYLGGMKLKGIWFEKGSQAGLVKLRNSLKEVGLRNLEREATYNIERVTSSYSSSFERAFKKIAFEWTCGYGFFVERPLIIIWGLTVSLSLIYAIPIYDTKGARVSTIYRVWDDNRIRQDLGGREPTVLSEQNYKALVYAFYFSLLSTFHFGWRDLNVGNWIARIQPQEYTLKSTGWVRALSGAQSLISVYLVALWVLSYFGRPFG